LAYYYDNQTALDAQIEREDKEVEALRAADAPNRPPRAELERRLRERDGKKP
jgi:hypothetical protein